MKNILARIYKNIWIRLQVLSIFKSTFRPVLLKWAGVSIGKSVHIGQGVVIDSLYPEDIEIGDNTAITMRCIILSHFMMVLPNGRRKYVRGKVKIGKSVFMGAHTIITKPVTIGDYCVLAAGSVVTKDIPPYEIWGGVPAKFIKRRN